MSVEELINNITDENYSKAEVTLNDLLADRMNTALEQEKIAVANQIYNGVDPDDEDEDEDQMEMDFENDEDEHDEDSEE